MSLRRLVTVALLTYVGASLAALAVGLARERSAAVPAAGESAAGPSTVVYAFHARTRCAACRTIEKLAQQTLQTRFGDELARGEIGWRVLDFEAPENEPLARQFQLFTSMVVLADGRSSPPARWKVLDEVWFLYDDPPAYEEYLARELRAFQEEGR